MSQSRSSRREFLFRSAVVSGGAAVLSALPEWAWALHAQADQLAQMRAGTGATPITSQALAPNLTMLAGPGGNVLVLNGADGKVIVDTFVQPAWGSLKTALDKIGNQKIATVIDTHWHFDHADNNAALRKEGAQVVAHDNTKLRMTQSHELLGAKIPPSPADALPTQTFSVTRRISANGETVMLGHIPPAHTDTDIYVRFEKANVLHLGDVFFNGMYPVIDGSTGGSINGMIGGVNASMKQADAATRIVPGHGPVGDVKALTSYRDMLVTVRDRLAKLTKSGQTLEQVVKAAPTKDLDATWGKGFLTPEQFLAMAYPTL